MITKLILFLALGAAAYYVLSRPAVRARPRRARAKATAEDLLPCPRCGAYAPAGAPCGCGADRMR